MIENGKPFMRIGRSQPAAEKIGCDQDRSRAVSQEAPREGRCQVRCRFDLVLAERHAHAPLGQLHTQRRCGWQSIFRDIDEKEVASLRRMGHGPTQRAENNWRGPL